MPEYISREAANEACREAARRYPNSFYNGIEAARDAIRKLPAADVRPVVRGRDCTFFKPQQKSKRWSSTTPMCSRSATIKMPPDGFCSFGVKREES